MTSFLVVEIESLGVNEIVTGGNGFTTIVIISSEV